MTQDQWVIDSATCRSRAHRLAEDDLPSSGATSVDRNSGMGTYNTMMNRHRAGKSMETYYRECLSRKGYKLVVPKPKGSTQA